MFIWSTIDMIPGEIITDWTVDTTTISLLITVVTAVDSMSTMIVQSVIVAVNMVPSISTSIHMVTVIMAIFLVNTIPTSVHSRMELAEAIHITMFMQPNQDTIANIEMKIFTKDDDSASWTDSNWEILWFSFPKIRPSNSRSDTHPYVVAEKQKIIIKFDLELLNNAMYVFFFVRRNISWYLFCIEFLLLCN